MLKIRLISLALDHPEVHHPEVKIAQTIHDLLWMGPRRCHERWYRSAVMQGAPGIVRRSSCVTMLTTERSRNTKGETAQVL